MLQITIPAQELFDERTSSFLYLREQTLQLEHSLVSISKWESRWHKPFLTRDQRTAEEMMDYIRCMTVTPNVDPKVYNGLTREATEKIRAYIDDPMTATIFGQAQQKKAGRQVITSELIYYWMVSLNIPFECQKWHLNRLLTLIHICDIKNQPAKKMSKRDLMARNRSLNAARRAKTGSRG